MFYESKHSIDADYFKSEHGTNFSYPLHIHYCFEILVVTDGEMIVTVDSETRLLKKNDAALVFPNQMHSMKTESASRHVLCIFSGSIVNYFFKKYKASLPENNFFTLPEYYIKYFSELRDYDDLCKIKGVLYLICGLFNQTAVYRPAQTQKVTLLLQILEYIENNYTSACTLTDISRALSYDYSYLSKFFIRSVGMPLSEYISRRRISDACHLLETTGKTVLEISLACGYSSLRSMNRNFRDITGISPAEYRIKNSHRSVQ